MKLFSFILIIFTSLQAIASELPHNESETLTQSYSINLTWINNTLDVKQRYIFPAANGKELHEDYLAHALTWCKLNPQADGGKVNIWYDSKMTTPDAVDATKKELSDHPITLRDIRTVPLIEKNEDIFTSQIPVYFRADLARVILSVHEVVTTASTRCFIFANCNMPPISKEAIFDPETVQKIKKYGLVMGYNLTGSNLPGSSTSQFENSFFMFSADNPVMTQSIQTVLIEGCISVARLGLNNFTSFEAFMRMNGRGSGKDLVNQQLPQFVYNMYAKLYSYFCARTKNLTLGKHSKIHGFTAFKNIGPGPNGSLEISINEYFNPKPFDILEEDKCQDYKDPNDESLWYVPTKQVSLPTAKLKYNTANRGNNSKNYL